MAGTVNLVDPEGLPNIIEGIEEYMQQHGVKDVNELIGALKV
jgi:dihydroorotate dehydrogenase (NAD+) catalytic subunit